MRRTDIKDLDITDLGIPPSIGNDEIDFVPSCRKTIALLQVYPQLVSLMGRTDMGYPYQINSLSSSFSFSPM